MQAVTLGLAVFIAASSGVLAAQSLGELARQETERRKTIQAPAKVLSNGDLTPVEASRAPAPIAATTAAAVTATPAAAMNVSRDAKYPAHEASYWLSRMRDLEATRDRLKLRAAALQVRLDGLTSEVDAARERRQRAAIEAERQSVRTERNLIAADIAAMDKRIFDLQEEARRSNVLPGWLRP
jgi:hypothetical protein